MEYIQSMLFGSHVYGTAIPTSDQDYKRIFIPSYRELLLQRAPRTICKTTNKTSSRNTENDVDDESFALHMYLKLLVESQTLALDMLFTPVQFLLGVKNPIWAEIQLNRDKIINKNVMSFVGYVRSQAHKYCIKADRLESIQTAIEILNKFHLNNNFVGDTVDQFTKLKAKYPEFVVIDMDKKFPTLEVCGRQVQLNSKVKTALEIYNRVLQSYGDRVKKAQDTANLDYKALYHAVRIAKEAEELLLTGFITLPRPEAHLLLRIRRGEIPYEQITEMIDQGLKDVESAVLKSTLRETADVEWVEDFICEHYRQAK